MRGRRALAMLAFLLGGCFVRGPDAVLFETTAGRFVVVFNYAAGTTAFLPREPVWPNGT